MSKADKNNAKQTIATQAPLVQGGINTLAANNAAQTGNLQNNATGAAATNTQNYTDVMNQYKQFLASQPNSGALINNFLNTNNTASRVQQPTTQPGGNLPPAPNGMTTQSGIQPPAPTGDANVDRFRTLLAKYGKTPGGAGSGFTDEDYWTKTAMGNASGDANYIFDRLEKDLAGNGPDAGSGGRSGAGQYGPSFSGLSNFAETGGFSPQDLASIRARAIAPIRGIADNARREISRSGAIRGTAYSPNTAAALAKSARDSEYAAGDISNNAEANIAQLVQSGKLSGLSGLSSLHGIDLSQIANLRGQDLSAILGAGQQSLGAMSGQTSLYGATPGLTNTFGNQALQSGEQGIQIQGLQGTFSQQQIQDAMALGQMQGIPWKQILAATAAGIGIAATGGTASPLLAPVVGSTVSGAMR